MDAAWASRAPASDVQACGSTQQAGVPHGADPLQPAAPAVKQLPWPRMRSERKTFAEGVVAQARAVQASLFAAAADSVETSCGLLQAPTSARERRISYARRLRG